MKYHYTILEILLVFALFFLYGAYTVPDVNEAHYLGKAAHFWNPNGYAPGDFFLSSPDAHVPFFVAIGWLTLFFSMNTVAWIGRILVWFLMACAWCYLCRGILPKWGTAILSAALFTCLMKYGTIAGEWVVGGVEGKGFAYTFVFFALGALVRNRWNTAWVLLGLAAMFHVIVGGWAIVAAGITWCMLRMWRDEKISAPNFTTMIPALIVSFLLTLPALLPALWLNAGTDPQLVKNANHLLVHERLSHHLLLSSIINAHMANDKIRPALFIFGAMILAWNMLCSRPRFSDADLRLRLYVYAAMLIFAAGWAINLFIAVAPEFTASLLRFYFFRLTDVMLPLGCAIMAVQVATSVGAGSARPVPAKNRHLAKNCPSARQGGLTPPLRRKIFLTALIVVSAIHIYNSVDRISTPAPPRSCPAAKIYWPWRDLCETVNRHTPPGETFIVPYTYRTFTWYSGRNVVVTWKDMPQDAGHLMEWWSRIHNLYYGHAPDKDGNLQYGRLKKFADTPSQRFPRMAKKYGVKYLVSINGDLEGFPVVYRNEEFSVWRIDGQSETPWE